VIFNSFEFFRFLDFFEEFDSLLFYSFSIGLLAARNFSSLSFILFSLLLFGNLVVFNSFELFRFFDFLEDFDSLLFSFLLMEFLLLLV